MNHDQRVAEESRRAKALGRWAWRRVWRAALFVAAALLAIWMLLHAHEMDDDFTWYGAIPLVGLLACFVLYTRSTRNEIVERIGQRITTMERSIRKQLEAKGNRKGE